MNDIKYSDYEQPRQLFLDTLVEFYAKLGNKEFWADMKKCEIALEALIQDYMRTDHRGHLEDATSLQAALNEYRIRERYLLMRARGTE